MKSYSSKLLFFCLLCISFSTFSQRYYTKQFSKLDSIIGEQYGVSIDYQGRQQELLYDFYAPKNDPESKRPLIIYIHGGGFVSGSRSYPSIKLMNIIMAQKGYAVASIDYRLDPNFDIYNSEGNRRAMTDAMHDAKQAVRYFKANANVFRIDTSKIFVGGESAGAITTMMVAYLNKQSEMASYPNASPNDPVGSSAYRHVSNKVAGAMCLCGFLLDTNSIETSEDVPLLWNHGTEDDIIPIGLSFPIVLRASHVGLKFNARAYPGGNHCPWYFGNTDWAKYLDTAITEMTNFLYPKVAVVTGIEDTKDHKQNRVTIYPNPASTILNVKLDRTYRDVKLTILSSTGKRVYYKHYKTVNKPLELDLSALRKGSYFLKIELPDDVWLSKNLVLH